jgi:hypothetical protein
MPFSRAGRLGLLRLSYLGSGYVAGQICTHPDTLSGGTEGATGNRRIFQGESTRFRVDRQQARIRSRTSLIVSMIKTEFSQQYL